MAFGLLLVAAELVVPSFTIVWFGLGACVTGLLLLVAPTMPPALQLLIWTISSTALTVTWFSYFRPKMADRTKAGMSHEAILGESGMIVKPVIGPMEKGRIRFPIPVLGAEEWDCSSEFPLATGDYATVTGIEGHVLTVTKRQGG
jgi:membrane protein implicated in regulation of membrane protease activity